ncbi:uncharacterized protein LOC124182593 [Neodiprion fabricii]|uniref:uncharacterized protein LOC124182593 n=1 Tax=Neodiprion fabricii TaxID=2872261 RepID=UPI001ED95107|nr:uncharacterized protein LOC124182593 [Neodiprion fabricii]
MEGMQKYFKEFHEVQTMLELQQPEEDHESVRMEIENNYYDATARARALIRACNPPTTQRSTESRESPNPFRFRGQEHRHKRLPQLNPPTFDGQLESWATFKTRFMSMINRNDDLSDSEKLEYLQSALTGKAAKT